MIAYLLNPTTPVKRTVQVIDAQKLDDLEIDQATPAVCVLNSHYLKDDVITRPGGRRYRRVQVVFSPPEPGRRYRPLDPETLWKLFTGQQQTASQVTDVLLRVE